jgi:hypothetical protein
MATSPNFGWLEPDNTDLVKNGALAIRTAIDGIDASLVDLKGGTTGQVLAKASGTDMDFSWVAQDDSNAIQNAIVTAKGDLIGATAADTPARLAVGTNGQVLTADSTAATGLAWAASSSFGTWAAWTPTYSAALTVGNGTTTARYVQNGKVVNFNLYFVWGSTTSISNAAFYFDWPIAPASTTAANAAQLNAYLRDANAADYLGSISFIQNTTSRIYISAPKVNGLNIEADRAFGTSVPWTWTTGDIFSVSGTYEVA